MIKSHMMLTKEIKVRVRSRSRERKFHAKIRKNAGRKKVGQGKNFFCKKKRINSLN